MCLCICFLTLVARSVFCVWLINTVDCVSLVMKCFRMDARLSKHLVVCTIMGPLCLGVCVYAHQYEGSCVGAEGLIIGLCWSVRWLKRG